MTRWIAILIAIGTICASALHQTSDIMEWLSGGFSQSQLSINYAGFVLMPFVIIGLYAVQRPVIGWAGLAGAVLYGISFIYFAHTSLFSLELSVPDYETLWTRLGYVYTFHGVIMIVGGLMFGVASLRASVLSRIGVTIFILGIAVNLLLGLLPVPDVMRITGSSFRNVGLIVIGIELLLRGTTDG